MRILIYGDSNSWGYLDNGSGIRHDQRWPVMMADQLNLRDVTIIEECLPGRTTAFADPQEGPEYNGLPYLRPALLSHAPLDWVLIMLGTNDCKTRFAVSAEQIAANLMQLARIAARAPVGNGKWRDAPPPKVAIICPPPIGARADDPTWLRHSEWQGGRAKTAALPEALKTALSGQDSGQDKLAGNTIKLFFAGDVVVPSNKDPIHLDAANHAALGKHIAEALSEFL